MKKKQKDPRYEGLEQVLPRGYPRRSGPEYRRDGQIQDKDAGIVVYHLRNVPYHPREEE